MWVQIWGEGGSWGGLTQWVQPYTEAQINLGDLTPYLTYEERHWVVRVDTGQRAEEEAHSTMSRKRNIMKKERQEGGQMRQVSEHERPDGDSLQYSRVDILWNWSLSPNSERIDIWFDVKKEKLKTRFFLEEIRVQILRGTPLWHAA